VTGGHTYRDLVLQVGGWTQGWRPCSVKNYCLRNPKKWKPDQIWKKKSSKEAYGWKKAVLPMIMMMLLLLVLMMMIGIKLLYLWNAKLKTVFWLLALICPTPRPGIPWSIHHYSTLMKPAVGILYCLRVDLKRDKIPVCISAKESYTWNLNSCNTNTQDHSRQFCYSNWQLQLCIIILHLSFFFLENLGIDGRIILKCILKK
jgi:hypothetical protein